MLLLASPVFYVHFDNIDPILLLTLFFTLLLRFVFAESLAGNDNEEVASYFVSAYVHSNRQMQQTVTADRIEGLFLTILLHFYYLYFFKERKYD